MYQVIKTNEDDFLLRGWDHKTVTKYCRKKTLERFVLDALNMCVIRVMFIENNQNLKKPLFVKVDASLKFVTAVVMNIANLKGKVHRPTWLQ
jgi:hypothetical protein